MTKKCNYCDGTGYAFGKIPCVCKDNKDAEIQRQYEGLEEQDLRVWDPTIDAAFPGLFAPGTVHFEDEKK